MAARGGVTWAIVFAVALIVGAMAVWVWPSTGTSDAEPMQVDTTGPVGRIGSFTTGTGTGATGALSAPDPDGPTAYAGLSGTGAVTGPIGGAAASRDASGSPTPGAASTARSGR